MAKLNKSKSNTLTYIYSKFHPHGQRILYYYNTCLLSPQTVAALIECNLQLMGEIITEDCTIFDRIFEHRVFEVIQASFISNTKPRYREKTNYYKVM